MLKFTVLPTVMVVEKGLKMFPGVKTSTVVVVPPPGGAAASPPPQPASRTPTMSINRRIRASLEKGLPTQYGKTRRISSTLMLGIVTSLTLLIAACSGDSATSSPNAPTSPVGAYQLTTVQGKALPYRMYSDVNYTVDVSDGTISLSGDGNFVATMKSEERVENHLSVYADTAIGKWALNGTNVFLTASDGSKTSGVWAGAKLTLTDSSGVTPSVYVYTMK